MTHLVLEVFKYHKRRFAGLGGADDAHERPRANSFPFAQSGMLTCPQYLHRAGGGYSNQPQIWRGIVCGPEGRKKEQTEEAEKGQRVKSVASDYFHICLQESLPRNYFRSRRSAINDCECLPVTQGRAHNFLTVADPRAHPVNSFSTAAMTLSRVAKYWS